VFEALGLFAIVVAALALGGIALVLGAHVLGGDSLGATLGAAWNPSKGRFGLMAPMLATLGTAALAALMALPPGFAAALWVDEAAPTRMRATLRLAFHLGAAIPGISYGLSAYAVLVPLLRRDGEAGSSAGLGLLTASVGLAAMMAPTIASIATDVIGRIPREVRDAALALGATRWEVVARVILPVSRKALAGAALLGFGRALGEAVVVDLLVGGRVVAPLGLLDPTSTLGSLLLDEWLDATQRDHLSALALAALVLAALSIGTHVAARRLLVPRERSAA
jgi:phosphate transport system permease protein